MRCRSRLALLLAVCLASLFTFASSVVAGREPQALPDIVVSRPLLESHALRVGDIVRLSADPSGTSPQEFRIAGVYEPVPDPFRFAQRRLEARLHLPDLLALTGDPSDPAAVEAVTAVNVALVEGADAGAFARDLSARIPGLLVRSTSGHERADTFVVLERFHLAIAVVTVVGSASFLLALMIMLVDERRGTVGALRLIGLPRRRILLQVLAEGVFIAAAGTVFGILFALATQGLFNRIFQWRYDTALVFLQVTPRVVWQSIILAAPLGVLASLLASWSLLRRNPLPLIHR